MRHSSCRDACEHDDTTARMRQRKVGVHKESGLAAYRSGARVFVLVEEHVADVGQRVRQTRCIPQHKAVLGEPEGKAHARKGHRADVQFWPVIRKRYSRALRLDTKSHANE